MNSAAHDEKRGPRPSVFQYRSAESTVAAAPHAYPYFYGYTMAIKICYRVLFYYEDKYLTDDSSRGRNARISTAAFPDRAWLQILLGEEPPL